MIDEIKMKTYIPGKVDPPSWELSHAKVYIQASDEDWLNGKLFIVVSGIDGLMKMEMDYSNMKTEFEWAEGFVFPITEKDK